MSAPKECTDREEIANRVFVVVLLGVRRWGDVLARHGQLARDGALAGSTGSRNARWGLQRLQLTL
jgi:hypothetical protein